MVDTQIPCINFLNIVAVTFEVDKSKEKPAEVTKFWPEMS